MRTRLGTLIRKLIAYWVERYGLSEVRKWFFESLERTKFGSLLDRQAEG